MNTEQEQTPVPGGESHSHPVQQQQQPQPQSDGHGGQGADSALKQMRAWEQRRAALTGGKRRQGPS